MHYCAYHKEEHEESAFRLKSGRLDSWCIEGRKESGRAYSKAQYAKRKAEVAQEKLERENRKTQVCTNCKVEKLIEEFSFRTDKGRTDKRQAKCGPCYKVWTQQQNKKGYDKHQKSRVQTARDDRMRYPEFHRLMKIEYDCARRADPVRQKHWIEMQRVHQANRRARERNAKGKHTLEQRQARIDLYGGLCANCKAPYEHMDHAIPLTQGGTNWPANLYPLCSTCNLHKWAHKPTLKAKHWIQVSKSDPRALTLADKHYSRRKPGAKQFMQPAKSLVLLSPDGNALWGSSWPKSEMVRHAWPDSWFCQIFRNEGDTLSSILVKEAVAMTYSYWRFIPDNGFITFIDADKIRRKRDPGRCYRKAGWEEVGKTKGGLVVLQLHPDDFPLPRW